MPETVRLFTGLQTEEDVKAWEEANKNKTHQFYQCYLTLRSLYDDQKIPRDRHRDVTDLLINVSTAIDEELKIVAGVKK